MDYDFSRFSSQSFERFSQSLAMANFGLGTQIYGSGPDGAREATFEGNFLPSPNEQMVDGYVVVQAKYLKDLGNPKDNLTWLKKQADSELKKFQDPERKLRKPDFYILVTNVPLTPGAKDAKGKREGSQDKMLAHMSSWKSELGVSNVFVWHADVLSALLDAHPELRETFTCWVTPGDVLAAALAKFKATNFETVLPRIARDELKDHRAIKTQDSAQAHDRAIYIDEVFVDLPLKATRENVSLYRGYGETDNQASDDENNNHTYISRFADEIANPVSLNVANLLMSIQCHRLCPIDKLEKRPRHRLVVLGGPGQGKSTIGQFVAQLLRAKLVLAATNVPYEYTQIAKDTIKRASEEGIDVTGPLRFPIHIALPQYADTISKNSDNPPSLLKYVATEFQKLSDEEVDPGDLRNWISSYPSMIVLDGLDEVPRTSNRADVIRAIERLDADIHEAKADTLMVVTSRPQGYLNDLDRKHWQHCDLAELDANNAVRFAQRLGEITIPDRYQRAEVIKTLTEASKEPSTGPLMISPLQVSLLLSLVLTRNDIPTDRWTLFDRHYQMLRDREIAKGGPNGDLIKEFLSEIDLIHYEAGFILQVRAEQKGNASAHFNADEFKSLIKRSLHESILEEEECEVVAEKIKVLATTRLVFLGDRAEGKIAFDVRSLQEFMAAARIMVSPEALIPNRLTEIALKSHWSNVFRIACSKIYSKAELVRLRDNVLRILDCFNSGDRGLDFRSTRAGAKLAVGLLLECSSGARQTDRANLAARAIKVLEVDSTTMSQTLAMALDGKVASRISVAIDENLKVEGSVQFLSTLRFLTFLTHETSHPLFEWAKEKLSKVPLISKDLQEKLLELDLPDNASDFAKERYADMLWAVGPHLIFSKLENNASGLPIFADIVNAYNKTSRDNIDVMNQGEEVPGIMVGFKRISHLSEISFDLPVNTVVSPGWTALRSASEFSREPTPKNLAIAFVDAREAGDYGLSKHSLPWPLASCIQAVDLDVMDFETLRSQICDGKQGGAIDWQKAESDWLESGVDFQLLPFLDSKKLFLGGSCNRAPSVRTISKREPGVMPFEKLVTSAKGWDLELRLMAFELFCFFAYDDSDAILLVKWLDEELISTEWSDRTNARAARLIYLAMRNPENFEIVLTLIEKIPSAPNPSHLGHTITSGFLKLLDNTKTRSWAVMSIYNALPRIGSAFEKVIEESPYDTLTAPKGSEPEVARAYLVARAVAGRLDPNRLDEDLDTLFFEHDGKFFSALLGKIYNGRRKNDQTELLVKMAALRALSQDYESRSEIIDTIAQLIESRDSQLENCEVLTQLELPKDIERSDPPPQ